MNSIKRASNFNSKEEALLISLVQKYKAIIECRKTDSVNNEKKASVWARIASEFNSGSGVSYRDIKILKNKYENIKKRTKKKSAEEKTSIFYTGGGPPENVTFTSVEEQVKDILGVRIDGRDSELDGDCILEVGAETSFENDQVYNGIIGDHDYVLDNEYRVENNVHIQNLDDNETEEEKQVDAFMPKKQRGDWKKGTPALLKQSKSLALQTPTGNYSKKREMSKKMERWAASKIDFEETKEKCLFEESEQRKKIMLEEHNKKMDILDKEYEERQKRENEEHKIRIEILLLQKSKT